MSVDVQILRPIGGESDYSVVAEGSQGYICARAQLYDSNQTVQVLSARYLNNSLYAKIYHENGGIPEAPPGDANVEQTDETFIAHFASIYGADFAASPGAINYLVVWWFDGTEYHRDVKSFFGVEDEDTECGSEGSGGGGQYFANVRTAIAANMLKGRNYREIAASEHMTRFWNLKRRWNEQFAGDNNELIQLNRDLVLRIAPPAVAAEFVWESIDTLPSLTLRVRLTCNRPLPVTYRLIVRDDPYLEYTCPAAQWNPRGVNTLMLNERCPMRPNEKAQRRS